MRTKRSRHRSLESGLQGSNAESLPAELLPIIFQHCVSKDQPYFSMHLVLTLSSVCKVWRAVLLSPIASMRHMWSYIALDFAGLYMDRDEEDEGDLQVMSGLKSYLARSQSEPLTIRITSSLNSTDADANIESSLMTTLLEKSSRWGSLHMDLNCLRGVCDQLRKWPPPNALKHLWIASTNRHCSEEEWDLRFRKPPRHRSSSSSV